MFLPMYERSMEGSESVDHLDIKAVVVQWGLLWALLACILTSAVEILPLGIAHRQG